MDTTTGEQRHKPQDIAGVRRVGCKHLLSGYFVIHLI